ncbi:MAG: ATP-binding protein [Enterocloster clostridioformis]
MDALTYIEQIYESANGMKVPLTGGNSMVNILVNNAQQQAASCSVPLTANIMVPPELPVENVDLCIILGNLLDNALEACCRMGKGADRFIHTEIRCQKAFLIISISNSYNGQLRMEGNRYESIKIGEQYCGIGLSNVSTVIHKYNGDMKISHNNDVFTVSVMLPLVRR